MTLYFGRVNYPTGITDPSSWVEQGDTVTCSGWLRGTSASHGLALRQQMTGYVDNRDEPFVHLASTTDATYGGFYTVEAMQVAAVLGSTTAYQWSATLRRVTGYASAQFEQISVGALRTNASSVVAATCIDTFWTGSNSSYWQTPPTGGSVSSGLIYQADKIMPALSTNQQELLQIVTNPSGQQSFQYGIGPAWLTTDPYVGAARLEVSYDGGTTYQQVIGTKLPDLGPWRWRLSNGLIRFDSDPTYLQFYISGFNPISNGTWSATKKLGLWNGGWSDSTTFSEAQPTVLRNSPNEVILRIPESSTVIDISIKAGQPLVGMNYAGPNTNLGIRVAATEAATAITAGIRATSNDAAGHRYVFASPIAVTNDLTNGSIKATASVSSIPLMIGYELTGSSSTSPLRAVDLVNQYMWASSHSMRILGR